MKKYIFAICMVFIMMGITGCTKDTQSSNSTQNLIDTIIGMHQDDIHKVFGEPIGRLSGFSGDMYTLDNGTTITVYYDENGKVKYVLMKDKSGAEVLTIE